MSGVISLPSMGGGIDIGKFKVYQRAYYGWSDYPIKGSGFVFAFLLSRRFLRTDSYTGDVKITFKDGNKKSRNFIVKNFQKQFDASSTTSYIMIGNEYDYSITLNGYEELKYERLNYSVKHTDFDSTKNDDVIIDIKQTSSDVGFYEKNYLVPFSFEESFSISSPNWGINNDDISISIIVCYVPK